MSEQESGQQDIPVTPEAEATETSTDAEKPAAPLSAEALSAKLAQAEEKIAQQQDQLLRGQADVENLKRRHTQALEKAHKFGAEKIVSDLLGVWDSLELGLQAAQDEQADVAKLREGTALTLKMLTDAMQKQGVEQNDPQGEPFNPELHQAMSMQPRDDVEPDTVIQVVQKGYSLNGRLVRPAMVMVSQAMPASEPAPAE
ncbi:MAG: nucleotide exchange factor GrpE [Pseudomonadota bacterium]